MFSATYIKKKENEGKSIQQLMVQNDFSCFIELSHRILKLFSAFEER
jgi:hypothetical protein